MRGLNGRCSGRASRLYQRAFTLTISEGAWNDWWISVEATDETGRPVCSVSNDRCTSVEAVVELMLMEVAEALGCDFLAGRPTPHWPEAARRWLVSLGRPWRNRWRQRRLARTRLARGEG